MPGYPDVDMYTIECSNLDASVNALSVAVQPIVKKKMAADTNALLGPQWTDLDSIEDDSCTTNLKPVEAIIQNIQDNWDQDATYLLCWPVASDGDLMGHAKVAQYVQEIGEWVVKNREAAMTPIASLDDRLEYTSQQIVSLSAEEEAKIYYTLDGTIPDENAILYTEPITLSHSTKLFACSYLEGKGKSRIMRKEYIIVPENNENMTLMDSPEKFSGDILKGPVKNKMIGMTVTTGKYPLLVDGIGRYVSDTGTHRLVIMPMNDGCQPLAVTDIVMDPASADEMGFQYQNIVPVRLEPFTEYRILSEEGCDSFYLDADTTGNEFLKWNDGAVSDYSLTNFYAVSYVGEEKQLLSLRYTPLAPIEINEKNIALGKKALLLDNSGRVRRESGGTGFAFHAIDGKEETSAVPTGAWDWTLFVDLEKVYSDISKIILLPKKGTYPSIYEIYASVDNVAWDKKIMS